MSLPTRIHLLRHGQSEGNANRDLYATTPDWGIQLTDLGREQARNAGRELARDLRVSSIRAYVSPYTRTLQTWEEMRGVLGPVGVTERQDPRLREQEWSASPSGAKDNNRSQCWAEAVSYGWFWYRFPSGESVADCYDRCVSFWRDLREDCAAGDAVIVSHGICLRVLLMVVLGLTVDQFYELDTPPNCARYKLALQPDERTYQLVTPFPRRAGPEAA